MTKQERQALKNADIEITRWERQEDDDYGKAGEVKFGVSVNGKGADDLFPRRWMAVEQAIRMVS